MIVRVCLLHLWCLSVVLGRSTDDVNINYSAKCYSVGNSTDQSCYVDCVRKNSQSSSDIIKLNKPNELKGYSGYAAVAAKLRYYKHQRDLKTKHNSESNEAFIKNDFIAVFIVTAMVFGVFCVAWFGNIPGDREWDESRIYLYIQEYYERLQNELVEETEEEEIDPLVIGGHWYAHLLRRLGYMLNYWDDCMSPVFDFVVSCIEQI